MFLCERIRAGCPCLIAPELYGCTRTRMDNDERRVLINAIFVKPGCDPLVLLARWREVKRVAFGYIGFVELLFVQ
jgi:hypothetical protein